MTTEAESPVGGWPVESQSLQLTTPPSRVDFVTPKVGQVCGITENVSARGALVVTESICAPGKLLRFDAPEEGDLKLLARVVYCQRLEEKKFAVGLEPDQLDVPVRKSQKSR